MADFSGELARLLGSARVATLEYEWNSRVTLFSNLKTILRFCSPLEILSAASLRF